MTDGIKFGSRAPSASFQRIPSVKLDNATPEKAAKQANTVAPQTLAVSLAPSIVNNKAAGSVLSKISQSLSSRDGRREVARANEDSARASVDEVESLAREIARRVAAGDEGAAEAHRAPPPERAEELLREQ